MDAEEDNTAGEGEREQSGEEILCHKLYLPKPSSFFCYIRAYRKIAELYLFPERVTYYYLRPTAYVE